MTIGDSDMRFLNLRMADLLQTALGRKKPLKKQDPRRFVPWLEALEDRRLLSISFTTVPGSQTGGIITNFDGAAITNVQAVATDTLLDQIVYSESGLPAGLSINSTTGLISGLISTAADMSSPYTVNLTATDLVTSDTANASFTWNVSPDPITFTNPGTLTNDDGATINLASGATDSQPNALTYTATGLPTGLSISSSTGAITGTITDAIVGISGVTNTVNPTITTAAANNLTVGESVTIAGVGGATGINGTFVVASVPTTTTFTITDATAPGDYTSGGAVTANFTVNVTATDATANASNSETFAWNVNASPVSVTAPATQTDDDGATVSLQVSAADSLHNTLTYSASNLPSGLTINSTTGKITGTIGSTADTGSPYTVTVTATDATANASTSQNFTWDVTTGPVTVTAPANQTSTGLAVIKLQVVATDSAGHKLTYSATGLPSGLTINKTTGVISGTIAENANSASPYSVNVTATDATANADQTQSFTWTVNPGPINGIVFLDTNGTGKLAANDPRLAGVTVTLTGTAVTSVNISGVTNTADPTITTATTDNLSVGNSITIAGVGGATGVNGTFTVASVLSETTFTITTTSAPGVYTSGGTISTTLPISVTCTTGASGNFSFANPPIGTYAVKVNTVSALIHGKPSIGNLVSASGITVTNDNAQIAKASKAGLAPTAISMNDFLTSTTALNSAFGPVGTGQAFVEHAPTVSTALAAVSLSSTSTTDSIDLAGHFTDAGLADSSVTLNITNGTTPETLTLTLFDKVAPQTVANFFDYIKAGEYNNSIFSRLVQNFVLQGGGATFTPASGSTSASITSIPIGPTVPNEFKTSNTLGTIAMAQSGSNINSATDQFFINTANNSATGSGTNLDASSFTVFGKVDASSMAALTALTKTTTLDASGSAAVTANPTVDMSNIPLTNYTAGTSTTTSTAFAADATTSNFMTINSVTINSQPEFLTYSVTSSNPSIVTASLDPVHNEQLTLTQGTATGTATVTVTCTDRFGLSTTSTITVTVS
jgi:cyclophilin family peptidyl-prolyl cis-trans isomerase